MPEANQISPSIPLILSCVPKADQIVPKADQIVPKADQIVPKADQIVPEADTLRRTIVHKTHYCAQSESESHYLLEYPNIRNSL